MNIRLNCYVVYEVPEDLKTIYGKCDEKSYVESTIDVKELPEPIEIGNKLGTFDSYMADRLGIVRYPDILSSILNIKLCKKILDEEGYEYKITNKFHPKELEKCYDEFDLEHLKVTSEALFDEMMLENIIYKLSDSNQLITKRLREKLLNNLEWDNGGKYYEYYTN